MQLYSGLKARKSMSPLRTAQGAKVVTLIALDSIFTFKNIESLFYFIVAYEVFWTDSAIHLMRRCQVQDKPQDNLIAIENNS